ncbi:MAG: tripartite tricarboxylate transporter substrate binding protein [Alphaproteobacteria bacterium]|nr:tripartite tricarboxylate transporter substrate binding protein [Alphaproteobacteria bacterium]
MTRLVTTRRRFMASTAAATIFAPTIVNAQAVAAWPSAKPIRMVVPFGTGGGTDITMRLLGPKISQILGQAVVIENRPGAGSVTGTDYVSKSPPDGYLFVLATLSSTGVAKGLYEKLPYDPVKDLTAIAPTNFIPICHSVTRNGLDVKNTQEWIAALKANPNKYSYGSSGVGSTGHIASANFLQRTGTVATHVPYRGAGQVFLAMVAGEVQFNSDIPSLMREYHDKGQVRIMFVATDERSSIIPNIPTAAEVGLPNYKAYSWYGIFGPAGLPQGITDRMAAAIEEALRDPTINKRLEDMGTPAMLNYTPAKFAKYVSDEIDIWVPITRASGAKAE